MTAQSETESWTIRRVLTWTQQRFTAQSLGSPRLDAELLLGHSLGWPRIALYTKYEQVLTPAELERFRGLIKRRLQGEPVAYLIGQKEFYSLVLQVTDAVLIPRPETELLVEEALARLPPRGGREAAVPSAPEAAPEPVATGEIEAAAEQQVPAERGVALTVHYEAFGPAELPDEPAAADAAPAPRPLTGQGPSEGSRDSTAPSPHLARLRAKSRAALLAQLAAPAAAPDGGGASGATAPGPKSSDTSAAPATGSKPSGASAAPATGSTSSGASAAPPIATIADVGTGSGAVALAIKHSRPEVRVLAIDRCDAALQVAAQNAERLGLAVEFLHGDLLAPLPPALRLDLITANLPYIPSAEIATLAPEVRAEPHGALDGGPDGLVLVRRLIDAAPRHLRRGGALLLEIGAGQHLMVEALLRAAGFVDVQSHQDLAQIPRVVVGHLR